MHLPDSLFELFFVIESDEAKASRSASHLVQHDRSIFCVVLSESCRRDSVSETLICAPQMTIAASVFLLSFSSRSFICQDMPPTKALNSSGGPSRPFSRGGSSLLILALINTDRGQVKCTLHNNSRLQESTAVPSYAGKTPVTVTKLKAK